MNKSLSSGIKIDSIFFVIGILVRVFSIPILIGVLGEEYYGTYVQINSLILFCTLLDIGFGVYAIKKISGYSFDKDFSCIDNDEIKTLNSIQLIIALFFILIGIIFSLSIDSYIDQITNNIFQKSDLKLFIHLSWVNIVLKLLMSNPRFLLKGRNQLVITNSIENLETILPTLLGCTLIYFTKKIYVLALCSLLISLTLNYLMLIIAKKKFNYSIFNFRINRNVFNEAFNYSYKFHLTKIVFLAKTQLIPFLIGDYFGASTLAKFNVYNKLYQLPIGALSKLSTNLLPSISNSIFNKGKNLLKQFKFLVYLTTSLIVLFMLSTFLFTDSIVKIWIGDNFELFDSIVLQLVILLFSVQICNIFYGLIIQSKGNFRYLPFLNLIELSIFLLIVFLFKENLTFPNFLIILLISNLLGTIYSGWLSRVNKSQLSLLPILFLIIITTITYYVSTFTNQLKNLILIPILILSLYKIFDSWKKQKQDGAFA